MVTTNRVLVLIGLTALLFGTLVYLTDRPPDATALPYSLNLYGLAPTLFGVVGQNLPAFAHVFAFSLLTAALLGNSRYVPLGASATWFFVNSVFEIGQHPAIAPWLSRLIPSWFENIPILARANGYFLYGTFDLLDLLFITLGALSAYLVLQQVRSRKAHHG